MAWWGGFKAGLTLAVGEGEGRTVETGQRGTRFSRSTPDIFTLYDCLIFLHFIFPVQPLFFFSYSPYRKKEEDRVQVKKARGMGREKEGRGGSVVERESESRRGGEAGWQDQR